jgi:hypothetical protein
MTYPFVELYGQATDQPSLGSEYLEGAELPKTDLGLEYTIQTGEKLEPLIKAMDVAKIPSTPFTVELLPLANMPFALSKTNIARAGQKAAEDVRQATKAVTEAGTKAIETVQETLATPPVGAISLDALGFSSRLSEGVDKLQDKGTGPQFLAQLSKMKGVPQAEIKVTGLDEYLKNTPKVTKQEVQDYLETNRLQLIEDERIAGAGRIDSEVVQYLPQQFDWLGKEDLAEEFEDKAHLRNHLIRTLDRHFDDLEAEADNTGSFYARDSSTGDLRYIPASKRFEWREAEIDKIDNELGDFPEFNGATNFEGDYQIPGGQNYREILYKLPDDKVEGVFRPPDGHFPNAENTFGSIRATDRTIDGTPTLFAEEIQSDWAIAGAKRGYKSKIDSNENALLVKQYDSLTAERRQIEGIVATGDDASLVTQNAIQKLNQINAELTQISDRLTLIRSGVPDNPFRGNWYKPVINNFLVKAAQEGKGGIGFPVGEIVKDRYNLANVVDRIESSTDRTVYPTPLRGGPFKTVTIDLKPALAGANEKQMSLRVDKDGLVRGVNADQYNRFIGKPLTEVVGKGVSEKILSNDSQVMTDLDLKIGGEGKDKLYDDMLPKHLNEIGKRYGVQLEKRTIPFSEGKKKESEVYFMPITEEMRNDILSEGLPMFKQGGSVKKFAPGGEVTNDEFIQEMMTGTRPEDFPETSVVDKKAGELLRALSESTRGFVGAEPIEAGSEAYRTGQALANMPAVGVVAATAKGAGKAKDALKSIVDPARLFEEVEKIPRNQVIDDLRSAHIGGVGDFGDSDAKYYFSQIPGGKEYIKKSQQVAKKNLGDRFMGYRLMSKDQFEDLQAGDVGDLLSFSLDQNTAEALRNFVTNQKRTDLVVAEVPLTPKHIVAFGHSGEKEIIVDTGVGWSMDEFKQAAPLKKAKGGALRSVTSGAQRAAKEGQKMLQGVYRGYTGERLEEPVLSTTPQRKVAEYYATRRAATRGEDPHIEMLMVDPFVGKEYGLALPIDEFNRELLTTRARAIAPSDVVERTQLKKKGGLACLFK